MVETVLNRATCARFMLILEFFNIPSMGFKLCEFFLQLVREKTKVLENRLFEAQNQLSGTMQEIMERLFKSCELSYTL